MIGADPQPTTVQHNRQQPAPQTTGLGVQRHPKGKHVGIGEFTGSFAGMKHFSRTEGNNPTVVSKKQNNRVKKFKIKYNMGFKKQNMG